jgi:peptidoglycan hydrolase-like protein with peptidoglycan-binding domain
MSLQKGDRGPGVQQLQGCLNQWIQGLKGGPEDTGLMGLVLDQSFGSNTQVALAAFQKARGLSPTGFADAATLEELGLSPDLTPDVMITTGGGIGD